MALRRLQLLSASSYPVLALAIAVLFLMLGLLVFPSRLLDVIGPALIVAVGLMLVAPPFSHRSSRKPEQSAPWRSASVSPRKYPARTPTSRCSTPSSLT